MNVKLEDFMKEVRKSVESFEKDWLANHRENPEHYPLEISEENAGVWYEFLMDHLMNDKS